MSASAPAAASQPFAPPRDGLVRLLVPGGGLTPGLELRAASEGEASSVENSPGTLAGHFAVFNRWTEIDSFFEGNFMERIAPGAFKKTFREQRSAMKVLFQHGRDMQIGSKPLGPITDLREDETGGAYEAELLDTEYVRELLPGLRAGLYGASFRFRVMREEIVEEPQPSDSNPRGLPERTVKEAQVYEFGPVTFPAYAEATAGLRSGTDDYFLDCLAAGDADAVRFASQAQGSFAMFIARRLGMESEDIQDRDRDVAPTAEAEREQEPAPEPEREQEPAAQQPQAEQASTSEETGASDAATIEPVTTNQSFRKEAAPGPRPTPLLGVRREPWRL